MRYPGTRLRALAARVCTDWTLTRVVDPALADLQREMAIAAGRSWGIRLWVRTRGYASLAAAACAHGLQTFSTALATHRAETTGVLAGTALVVALMTGLMVLAVPLIATGSVTRLRAAFNEDVTRALPYLIPQALPVALPVGILCGAIWGVIRGAGSRFITALVLGTAVSASLASAVLLARVIPDANQAYREIVFAPPPRQALVRGANELSWSELRRAMTTVRSPRQARMFHLSFHVRIAFSLAPLIAGLLALSALRRLARGQATTLAAAAFLGYVVYFVGINPTAAIESGRLSPALVAWLPNAATLMAALGLELRRVRD